MSSALSLTRSLLAVIHRDGGHYTEKHGLAKALEDAAELVVQERVSQGARAIRWLADEREEATTFPTSHELRELADRIERGEVEIE